MITSFYYGGEMMDAADFGNFNAGYTGTIVGISSYFQYLGAGFVENLKNNDWANILNPSSYIVAPFGDRERDFKMNQKGMKAAEKYKKISLADMIYSDILNHY